MEALIAGLVILLLVVLFLGLGFWIFSGLFLVSVGGLVLLEGMPLERIGIIATNIIYSYSSAWELAAIPMFIWMGEIIFRTDLSDRLFRGFPHWWISFPAVSCIPISWDVRSSLPSVGPVRQPRLRWARSQPAN
ncbi:hypothetical protein [Fodinicurvata halophila]|uniref:hypothetical protein n=1 Tax=Fodinicurvata halophila TaxID=1419723 RepID=UPI003638455B